MLLPRPFLSLSRRCCGTYIVGSGGQNQTPRKKDPPAAAKNPLLRELCQKIRFTGPLTVHQYMREVLTNPKYGYYMKRDVFGTKGDFITSPEISQMFGECLAIWMINEWMKMGSPSPMQIVEFGPGRGTLMADVLRTWTKLYPDHLERVSVHLIEVSPALKAKQRDRLCRDSEQKTKYGASIEWHADMSTVPKGFAFYLAHEFFDALPIHKFTRRDPDDPKSAWLEVLVDIDPSKPDDALRLVRSNGRTPACAFLEPAVHDDRVGAEVAPDTAVIVKEMCNRIVYNGGAALIADYGHTGDKNDTFRAFRNHELSDPLVDPGTSDLTADVDFRYLGWLCDENEAAWHGPVMQKDFLHQMGIQVRVDRLAANSSEAEGEGIKSAYHTLTDEDKMGERFKFMAIFPKTMKVIHDKYPPAGFV